MPRRSLLLAALSALAASACSRADLGARPRGPLPNTLVYDQHGTPLHFYDDVLRGSTFLLSFIFTSCRQACPITARNLALLRRKMTPSESRIRLVSISIDPEVDTSDRLLAWSRPFQNDGWTLLTSSTSAIESLTLGLTGARPSRNQHLPIALIGKDPQGSGLVRASTLDTPDLLLSVLRRVDRGLAAPIVP